MDSLEEMGKFLKTYSLLQLNYEEIENLDRSIASRRLNSNQTSQQTKVQDQTASLVTLSKHLRELIPILLKLFQKIEEGPSPNLFYEGNEARVALMGFPSGTVAKNLPASAGDTRESGSVPGLGRPLQ